MEKMSSNPEVTTLPNFYTLISGEAEEVMDRLPEIIKDFRSISKTQDASFYPTYKDFIVNYASLWLNKSIQNDEPLGLYKYQIFNEAREFKKTLKKLVAVADWIGVRRNTYEIKLCDFDLLEVYNPLYEILSAFGDQRLQDSFLKYKTSRGFSLREFSQGVDLISWVRFFAKPEILTIINNAYRKTREVNKKEEGKNNFNSGTNSPFTLTTNNIAKNVADIPDEYENLKDLKIVLKTISSYINEEYSYIVKNNIKINKDNRGTLSSSIALAELFSSWSYADFRKKQIDKYNEAISKYEAFKAKELEKIQAGKMRNKTRAKNENAEHARNRIFIQAIKPYESLKNHLIFPFLVELTSLNLNKMPLHQTRLYNILKTHLVAINNDQKFKSGDETYYDDEYEKNIDFLRYDSLSHFVNQLSFGGNYSNLAYDKELIELLTNLHETYGATPYISIISTPTGNKR